MTTSKRFDELLNQGDITKVEVDRGIEPVKAVRKVKPYEAQILIGGDKLVLGGLPMFNIRTRMIEV